MKIITHKALLLCLILPLIATTSYGQEEFDPNRYLGLTTTLNAGEKVEIAISKDAWIDLNANGQQDEGEVVRLKSMDGQPDQGIQNFTVTLSAQTFRIYGNFNEIILRKWRLSKIDVSRMTQLTYLGVPYSKLDEIDLSALTKLKSFEGRNNRFTELDLSHQPNLELVEVISNDLTRLDITKKPHLYFVGVAHNAIRDEAMDLLVNALPMRSEGEFNEGQLYIYTLNEPTEKNYVTDRQAAIADGKYWNVQAWDKSRNDWVKYLGEPTAITEVATTQTELRALYSGSALVLIGTTLDEPVRIYDYSGALLATFAGDLETTTYPIALPAGSYIITHCGATTTLQVL